MNQGGKIQTSIKHVGSAEFQSHSVLFESESQSYLSFPIRVIIFDSQPQEAPEVSD